MYTCGRFSDSLEYQGQTAPLEESVLRHSPWFTGQCQEKDRLLVIHAIWKIVDDRLTLHSILTDAVDEVSPIALAVPKLGMYNLEFPIAASWFSGTLTVRNQPLPGFFGNGYGWKIGSLQLEVHNGLAIGRRSLSERIPLDTRRKQRSRAYNNMDR